MKRRVTGVILGVLLATGGTATAAFAGELKAVHTRKAKDVVISIKSESGQWTRGDNSFVLEFTSAGGNQPLDVGRVRLEASMAMPGMAPMLAGATLTPDRTPGRFAGTISFPDPGSRQVTVRWDGPAGRGSATFSVPVR